MTQHISEEEDTQFAHVLPNKPRHVVFTDEAIGKLTRVARLISFHIDTPEDTPAHVHVVLKDLDNNDFKTYIGDGLTVGHALREMLDKVNLDYPLGEEE